jgi:hypothetical protein
MKNMTLDETYHTPFFAQRRRWQTEQRRGHEKQHNENETIKTHAHKHNNNKQKQEDKNTTNVSWTKSSSYVRAERTESTYMVDREMKCGSERP